MMHITLFHLNLYFTDYKYEVNILQWLPVVINLHLQFPDITQTFSLLCVLSILLGLTSFLLLSLVFLCSILIRFPQTSLYRSRHCFNRWCFFGWVFYFFSRRAEKCKRANENSVPTFFAKNAIWRKSGLYSWIHLFYNKMECCQTSYMSPFSLSTRWLETTEIHVIPVCFSHCFCILSNHCLKDGLMPKSDLLSVFYSQIIFPELATREKRFHFFGLH